MEYRCTYYWNIGVRTIVTMEFLGAGVKAMSMAGQIQNAAHRLRRCSFQPQSQHKGVSLMHSANRLLSDPCAQQRDSKSNNSKRIFASRTCRRPPCHARSRRVSSTVASRCEQSQSSLLTSAKGRMLGIFDLESDRSGESYGKVPIEEESDIWEYWAGRPSCHAPSRKTIMPCKVPIEEKSDIWEYWAYM